MVVFRSNILIIYFHISYDDVQNEDIHGGQRIMHICKKKVNGQNQSCPDEVIDAI